MHIHDNSGEIHYEEYLIDLMATVSQYYPNSPLLEYLWCTYEEVGYVSNKDYLDLLSMQEEHEVWE
jgi:hypothetical protein